jgi:hypothetical protein
MPRTRRQFQGEHDPADEIRYLRARCAELEAAHESYRKEHGKLESLFRTMAESIDALPPPKIDYRAPRADRVSAPVVHVAHWTDWHVGAVQEPDEIEGFNAFNLDILRRRLINCVRDQLRWIELHRRNYTINTLHNLFTGDMCSGGIHQELLVTNEFPEPVQAIKAGEMVAQLVATQAPHYEKVVCDFLTTDNHSRLTKKPQAAEAGLNTWGYVVGYYAKERLSRFPNVEFNIHPYLQHVVECGGAKYMLTHGHTVMGWAGFPYYGIGRMVGREAEKRMARSLRLFTESGGVIEVEKVIGKLFHRIVMGHWHAPLWAPMFTIGGCACGTTTYDHSQGRHADPQQGSWLVHPRHGEFDRTDWKLKDDAVE